MEQKTLTNAERREELTYLAEINCPGDRELILSRMPIQQEDSDGQLYAKYFSFLQAMYNARSGLDDMSTDEVMFYKQHLLDVAYELRYPTSQIIALGD